MVADIGGTTIDNATNLAGPQLGGQAKPHISDLVEPI